MRQKNVARAVALAVVNVIPIGLIPRSSKSMPLFNVTFFGRKSKVLIRAETLQSLTDSAKIKLNLKEETYQHWMKTVRSLTKMKYFWTAAQKLILLEPDQSWQSPVDPVIVANIQTEKEVVSIQDPGTSDPVNPPQTGNCAEKFTIGASIWEKFPSRLMTHCESGKIAYESDRRNLVATIAEHMLYDLKDDSRKTAQRFAKAITTKYPATFADIIGDNVVGDGMETFRQQIYTAVQYRKKLKELKRKAEMQQSDDSGDDALECVAKKSRKQDECGCAEYQPLLTPTESATSQKEEKLLLIDFRKNAQEDHSKILALMDDTYPSQRIDINNKKRDFERLFMDWPYLSEQRYLINHASRLLGKSVSEVWEELLSANAKPLCKYIAFMEKTKAGKSRKAKGSTADYVSTKNEILEMLSQAKEASKASKSEVSMFAVIFPLVAKYLSEDPELLCRVIPEDIELEKLKDYASHEYPLLLIRGKSLFDGNAKCDVVIEKTVTINVQGVVNGFLTTFIAYYVFGYVYHRSLAKTLEFIQRVLLQINPPKGHKQGDKKRKATPCNASVMKLAKALAVFKED